MVNSHWAFGLRGWDLGVLCCETGRSQWSVVIGQWGFGVARREGVKKSEVRIGQWSIVIGGLELRDVWVKRS
jgi:hypothetical protein